MGNKSSSLEAARNAKIQQKINKDRSNDESHIKLLLLGAGESGKSTIFKQMKMLYGKGFSEENRKLMAPDLIANLVEGAKEIIKMALANDYLTSSSVKQAAEVVNAAKDPRILTDEIAKAITKLWKDKGFQKAWNERSKFQVQDTWGEFADQVKDFPEWGGPKWTPSVEDVMRARIRTSGVVDEMYQIRNVSFRMFDVGGQRNERRKWIHCFEGVTAVIFVAAMSEYDQVLFEDATQNRLVEALDLFKEISNSRWFKRTAMILFLNKRDLFQDKLVKNKVPLNVSGNFPDAPGGDKTAAEYEVALKWITDKFKTLAPPSKDLYTHVTCATDTQNISTVFNASAEIILKENLLSNGFMDTAPRKSRPKSTRKSTRKSQKA